MPHLDDLLRRDQEHSERGLKGLLNGILLSIPAWVLVYVVYKLTT